MQEEKTVYDTIIVGAGPAGLTAAIYLLRAGKKVLMLEKETIGGGIASTPKIENYPGFASISGENLADNLFEQVTNLGGELEVYEVINVEKKDNSKVITVYTDGPDFFANSIIIATGTKYRKLNLPNEENLIGHGISFCVTCDGAFYKDQVVAVIGGGNSAVTNALELSEICKKVIVVQNLSTLTAEETLVKSLNQKENVEIICNAVVTELIGNEELEAIKIKGESSEETIKLDGMFISIGRVPETEFIKEDIQLNKYNYVDSGEDCHTSKEGVFVAGDVRNKAYRQITTSTSDGTIAALEVVKYLKENL